MRKLVAVLFIALLLGVSTARKQFYDCKLDGDCGDEFEDERRIFIPIYPSDLPDDETMRDFEEPEIDLDSDETFT